MTLKQEQWRIKIPFPPFFWGGGGYQIEENNEIGTGEERGLGMNIHFIIKF